MRRGTVHASHALLLLCVLASCTADEPVARDGGSGGMDAGTDAGPLMAPGEYWLALAAARNAAAARCWTDPWHTGPLVYTGSEDGAHQLDELVQNGDVLFDAAAAAACLGGLGALACDANDLWELEVRIRDVPECQNVLVGTHGGDWSCRSSFECISRWCNLNYGCPGFCMGGGADDAFVSPDAGSPPDVGPPPDAGPPPSFCTDEPTPSCVRARFVAALGEVCGTSDGVMCAPGLVCGYDEFFTQEHHCEVPYERGGRCHRAVPEGCPSGQICDGVLCADFPGEGQPCLLSSDASYTRVCAAGLGCVPEVVDGSYVTTCRRTVGVGETCSLELPCGPGLFCDRTTCIPWPVAFCPAWHPTDVGPLDFLDSGVDS